MSKRKSDKWLKNRRSAISRWLDELEIDEYISFVAVFITAMAVVIGIETYRNVDVGFWELFGANFSTELASIAITVIVIDQLYRRRSKREYKRQIIKQMGSPVHDAAVEAARVAREKDWLDDGSLKGAHLYGANLEEVLMGYANLEGASLYKANLKGANLQFVNLEGAQLFATNFKGADLQGANLKGADLMKANLEGADLGHANLEGAELAYANLSGVKYNDETKWPYNLNLTGVDQRTGHDEFGNAHFLGYFIEYWEVES